MGLRVDEKGLITTTGGDGQPVDDSIWELYDAWNSGIQREFLSGQSAGRPLYLDLEEDVLARIGAHVGKVTDDPVGAFTAAVRSTLRIGPGGSLFGPHLSRARAWERTGREGTPPFLALLAFLSLVAEGMRSDQDFRASNYYGRLCKALDLDPRDERIRNRVARHFRRDSHELWGFLNAWLEDNDGRLGLPTAYAFDYRVHVGIPMSQALVRESDRVALRELFEVYRLRPGQALARSDMARLLEDWIPHSRLSQSLKRLCGQGEALERVADVACIELQAWMGPAEGDPSRERSLEGDLLVGATIRRHPRPRLALAILTMGPALPTGTYVLDAPAGSHALAAVEGTGGSLELEEPTAGEIQRQFAGGLAVSMPDLLLARMRLRNGEATLKRDPHRLVVLEADEEFRRYVEVERVQLGRENLLLCHESLRGHLESVLEQVARSGYDRHSPEDLPGLPEAWLAYEPVEVLGIADTELADLAPLVPLSWTAVSLGGGYPLPGRSTWLRERVPEARVSSFAEQTVAAVLVTERVFQGEPAESIELATFSGSEVLSLKEHVLDDGDYRLALTKATPQGATLASDRFRIRSADHSRLLPDDELLAHSRSSTGWWALSANGTQEDSRTTGASVPAQWEVRVDGLEHRLPPRELRLVGKPDAPSEAESADQPSVARGGEAPVCLMGGGHYFVLEDAGRERRWQREIGGVCKRCGLEKWFPARPRGRRQTNATGGRRAQAPIRPVEIRPIEPASRPDVDVLLEALCFAQAGSWSAFDSLASRVDDAPWFSLEVARLLSSLGHLDLKLDSRTLRPERWAVAPPTLALIPEGGAVACGYRSERMLDRLRDDVEALGGEVHIDSQAEAPRVARLNGLVEEELREIAASAAGVLGIVIHVSTDAALRLASALPTLEDLRSVLPVLDRAPDVRVERFDFETANWQRHPDTYEPGAYRLLMRPMRYVVRCRADPGLRIADNRLAKWMAASELGLEMLAYEPNELRLICPLGAQLPGLFERAAVLASGQPPARLTNGTVVYRSVPFELAALLSQALTMSSGEQD
jgi:hypothetical protein